jgi:predicted Mrr-cat superfamily restriction endonuclease
LAAANELINELDGIQSKITSIISTDVADSTANELTDAVKNAELEHIKALKSALDKVQLNTIPAEWINTMLNQAKTNGIVAFFSENGIGYDANKVRSAVTADLNNKVSKGLISQDKANEAISIIMKAHETIVTAIALR